MMKRRSRAKNWQLYEKGLRECSICGKAKFVSEFYKSKLGFMGLGTRCKTCNTIRMRKYWAKDPENRKKQNARMRKRYWDNHEEMKAYSRKKSTEYYRRDLDYSRKRNREYYHRKKNREKSLLQKIFG